MTNLLRIPFLVIAIAALNACGSGSGAATSDNPVTSTPDVSNYTGPAPATADVRFEAD